MRSLGYRALDVLFVATWTLLLALMFNACFRDVRPPTPCGLPGSGRVILIHGMGGEGSDSMRIIRERLIACGQPPETIIEPKYNSEQCVEISARSVADQIGGTDSVRIVAHSLGVLVAREFDRTTGRVSRAVYLDGPNAGLDYARPGPICPVNQMIPGSPFLTTLNAYKSQANITTYSCESDPWVSPDESAFLEGAENILTRAVNHVTILSDSAMVAEIQHKLGE